MSFSKNLKTRYGNYFSIEGKSRLSGTITHTTVEFQGYNEFCWLYALADSIVASLWIRLGKIDIQRVKSNSDFSEKVRNVVVKERGADFLRRHDLKQKIRRELYFGLFPKTHKGKKLFRSVYINKS